MLWIACLSTALGAPIADAGSDQQPALGDTVYLDATDSSDVELYRWKVTWSPYGSSTTSADIDDRDAAETFFTPDITGRYGIGLRVDEEGRSRDTVVVRVLPPANTAPVAGAGEEQSAVVGDLVQLAGQSTDADGDVLTVSWSLDAAPAASALTTWDLSDPLRAGAHLHPRRRRYLHLDPDGGRRQRHPQRQRGHRRLRAHQQCRARRLRGCCHWHLRNGRDARCDLLHRRRG